MKLYISTAILFLSATLSLSAQNEGQDQENRQPGAQSCTSEEQPVQNNRNTGLSAGYHVNKMYGDYGMGVHITSPYFLYKRLALRISGNMANHYGIINDSYESGWYQYYSLQGGLVGVLGNIGKRTKVYAAGGAVIMYPNTVTGLKPFTGVYGHLGTEYTFYPSLSASLEMGAVHNGNRSQPETQFGSSRFSASVGLHCYF